METWMHAKGNKKSWIKEEKPAQDVKIEFNKENCRGKNQTELNVVHETSNMPNQKPYQ